MTIKLNRAIRHLDFIRWFITDGPYANVIDKSRVSVYGWSYGGYSTTLVLAYGGGGDPIFQSGVAVAPGGDQRMYDAMYTERYMDYRGVENEIGEKHWFNSSMVDHTMSQNQMKYFRNASYNLIHGMNDDNVHFINSAAMEKALVSVGIDFTAFVSDDSSVEFL